MAVCRPSLDHVPRNSVLELLLLTSSSLSPLWLRSSFRRSRPGLQTTTALQHSPKKSATSQYFVSNILKRDDIRFCERFDGLAFTGHFFDEVALNEARGREMW